MKKKTGIITGIACGLLVIAAVIGIWEASQRGGTLFEAQTTAVQTQEELAHQMYLQKHPYIGRVPVNLTNLLGLPEGIYHYATQRHTTQLPYGYQEWLYTTESTYHALINDPMRQDMLQKNALILMALIENCDFVDYSVKHSEGRVDYNDYPTDTPLSEMGNDGFTLHFTKEWADAALGKDIKTVADTEENFALFLSQLDEMDLPAVQAEIS